MQSMGWYFLYMSVISRTNRGNNNCNMDTSLITRDYICSLASVISFSYSFFNELYNLSPSIFSDHIIFHAHITSVLLLLKSSFRLSVDLYKRQPVAHHLYICIADHSQQLHHIPWYNWPYPHIDTIQLYKLITSDCTHRQSHSKAQLTRQSHDTLVTSLSLMIIQMRLLMINNLPATLGKDVVRRGFTY